MKADALEPAATVEMSLREVTRLRRALRGELVLRADPFYERARQVWNGLVDKRPAAIAYCACAQDVVAALAAAREGGLSISVRSGGHNVAGKSVCEGGLVIDLSRMKNRLVEDSRLFASAEAGLTLAEFDRATQACGLATTMGVNGDTGIAGLTLGGGFGKLGRRFGLACDNLLSAQVVTADGRVLHASADENPDLFWGLRGGGGNFGIVTRFDYRLHAIGTTVLAGSLVFPEARARDALKFYGEFARNAPDELSLDADVFDVEPTPADNPLLKLDNVVLTPHLAGPTADNQQARFRNAFDNCQRVARGEKPLWVIPELQ